MPVRKSERRLPIRENAGYLIMAHSILDTGARWTMALTVGWYA